jgi:hypothetical protein
MSELPPRNTIRENGISYSTLQDVPVDGGDSKCQSQFLALPAHWYIAEENSDAKNVIREHTWSTLGVVVSSGKAFGTVNHHDSPGRQLEYMFDSMLDSSGGYFRVVDCSDDSDDIQILIQNRKPVSNTVKTYESLFGTCTDDCLLSCDAPVMNYIGMCRCVSEPTSSALTHLAGDGYCDWDLTKGNQGTGIATEDYNNANCNFDGGDCCEETCVDRFSFCAVRFILS